MLGLGRAKESSREEEDFPQWSKKTEAFFAGVIKESEMMVAWAAEEVTEISTELIDRDFLPTATNQERGVQNLEFVFTADAYNAYGSHELRGERHCCQLAEESIGGMATTAEEIRPYNRKEGRETFFALSFLRDDALFWNYVLQYEKMLKNKINDEIKLAGLEALAPEELEKTPDSQLQSPSNFRGCTSGSRDERGGEVRFKNS